MDFEQEIAELRALLQRLIDWTEHQRDLLDQLQEQIARFNGNYFPYQQPIKLVRDEPPDAPNRAVSA
jgi:hypothetical protein